MAQDNQNIIYYLYTAEGQKLQKRIVEQAGSTSKTDYFGGRIYESGQLKEIAHEEGRILATTTGFEYHYYLRDHLGNVRVEFKEDADGEATITQENHYYPFGMRFSGEVFANNDNDFRYNGKEMQEDFGLDWYDYGARFYDPALGRWHAVDPLSEKYERWSSYSYSMNNPIRFIDIEGMFIGDPVKDPKICPTPNNGKAGGRYGNGRGRHHNGLDIKAPVGTELKSIKEGEVYAKGDNPKGLGKYIIIRTRKKDGGYIFHLYAHLKEKSNTDGKVEEGDVIGVSGKSGNAKTVDKDREHVHLIVREGESEHWKDAEEKNPEDYLDTKFDKKGNPKGDDSSDRSIRINPRMPYFLLLPEESKRPDRKDLFY